ncbi:MAG: YncE family protein [Gemmatimonadales bacterium]
MRPIFMIVTLLLSTALGAHAQQTDYLVFVAAEAADRISLVRFGPAGARVDREFPVGLMPTDPDGPHGLAVSPDGRHLFVSTAHGNPFGYLWKLDAETGRPVGRATLGYFPATLQLTPDGYFALVVNFNLHGDMVPSSVSVVATDSMLELTRIPTCVMPHGSRVNPQGTKQYSACMMDDLVVEIDTRTFAVARSFRVARGAEQGFTGLPAVQTSPAHTPHPTPHTASCSPTWAQPSADGERVFVACNKSNEIVVLDIGSWAVTRRIAAGDGVYNLAVTHDGKLLLATNKRGQSVSVFDAATGAEVVRISTIRKIVHGVVVSPDDRYAFVSVEGIGAEPGTVEVIDLAARRRVAAADVGQMAGGIDFWKTERARP